MPQPIPAPTPPGRTIVKVAKSVLDVDGKKFLNTFWVDQNGVPTPAMIPALAANGTYQMVPSKLESLADLQKKLADIQADITLLS